MKKGKSKKLAALLLAFAVLMSPSTGISIFADEPEDIGQDAVVNTNEQAVAADDQGSADNGAVAGENQSDPAAEGEPWDGMNATDPTDTDESVEQIVPNEDSVVEEQPTEGEADAEEQSDPEFEDGGLINNLFIEEQTIQAPGELNAIISFGEGDEQLESVKLILSGDDGRQSEIPLTQKVLNYYQFKKNYESQETGTHRLIAFTYELEGHKKRIDFVDTGIVARFSVIGSEDGCAEEAEISVTALTSDEISTDLTYDIENTIQEAAQDAVDNVIEGAVELGSSSTEQSYGRAGVSAELTEVVDRAVTLGSYSASRAYAKASDPMVIVLDPGHGGSDPGSSNQSAGLVESKLNLKVANYCKNELEKYSGIKVYMTRTGDTTVSLEERVRIAKNYGADLFVSIHMNAASSSSAQGAEVYYPNANYNSDVSKEGKDVAENILKELTGLGLVNRNVRTQNYPKKDKNDSDYEESIYSDGSQADYYSVIRNSKKNGFAGIIVEHAFITSETDAKNLKKESFLKDLGEADARGIVKCYGLKMDSVSRLEEYSAVFDFDYYLNKYSDLQNEYAHNPEGALDYFIAHGMSAGQQASAEFNVEIYRKKYLDLRNAFGSDLKQYYLHYMNFGKAEGRIATDNTTDNTTDANVAAVYDGVNYADVYDFNYYIGKYKDLKAVFANNSIGALEHFVKNGMTEGRQAKDTFNVYSYKNRYSDLRKAFGSNLKAYYLHYINNGKKEGRIATDSNSEDESTTPVKGTAIVNGVDLSPVYDFAYYIEKYPDIKKVYGDDPDKAIKHFVKHGMTEGRSGNADFDVYAYKNRYTDLQKAFGNNLKEYYMHYIEHGIKEGRSCAMDVVTAYRGVDYSAVYNFEYYIGKYSDLAVVFEHDPDGALQHFIEHGIREGRQANEEFNINAYKNNYADLRKAFGDNNQAYVEHYISIGKSEGRNAANFTYHRIDDVSFANTKVDQMVRYFLANASYPSYYANNTDVPTIKEFCELYVEECAAEKINVAVAFCQAMKETNFLRFTGDVKVSQYNFAGLGATGNGVSGLSFANIRTGVRAHVQHLKAYANSDPLNNTCVDPRFGYVQRGSAMYVEWLGIQENPIPGCGWATASGYGPSILNDFMAKLLTY